MEFIFTDKAPQPIGPYSQAVKAGGFIFLSGQISLDPKTNALLLFEGDAGRQAEQVLKNIEAVLASQNLDLKAVVKTTVFLKNMSDFGKVNAVYARFFGPHTPARSTVEVSALPKGVAVEIEVIVYSLARVY